MTYSAEVLSWKRYYLASERPNEEEGRLPLLTAWDFGVFLY